VCEQLDGKHPSIENTRLKRLAFWGRLLTVLGGPCLLLALMSSWWASAPWEVWRVVLEIGGVFALIHLLPYVFVSPPVLGDGERGLKFSVAWIAVSWVSLVLGVIAYALSVAIGLSRWLATMSA